MAASDFSLAADLLDPPKKVQAVSLAQAAQDPDMLGTVVRWWPRQIELLGSLDGPEQLHMWALGRQAGKTTMAAAAALHNATMRPDLDEMLPHGRIRYVLIGAAGQAQAIELIKVCRSLLEASPIMSEYATILTERIDFELPGGYRTAIRAMPAYGRTARGLSASLLILDEFAHAGETAGPGSDEQLWAALVPSLRAFGAKAKTLVISTPAGRTGKFFTLFESAKAGLLPSANAVQATVNDVVPDMDPDWLDARRAELGESLYAQEFEASFVDAGGAFFNLSEITLAERAAEPGEAHSWVCALDPAFHADGFGFALVGEARYEPGKILVGAVGAIPPQGPAASYDARRAREDKTLAAIWERIAPYEPVKILSDQKDGPAIAHYFERRGIQVEIVNWTLPLRTQAFVELRARIMDGSLRLWDEARTIEELRRVRAKQDGHVHLPRYGDSHCDAAAALALATQHAEESAGLMVVQGGKPQLFGSISARQHVYSGSQFG